MSDLIFVVGLVVISFGSGVGIAILYFVGCDPPDPIGWLINLGRSARQTSREIDSFERGAQLPTARVVRR